jgi:hypothetical protein
MYMVCHFERLIIIKAAARVYILLRDVDRLNGEQPSLYELLLQREMLADKLESEGRGHLIVRKSDRSPSLR